MAKKKKLGWSSTPWSTRMTWQFTWASKINWGKYSTMPRENASFSQLLSPVKLVWQAEISPMTYDYILLQHAYLRTVKYKYARRKLIFSTDVVISNCAHKPTVVEYCFFTKKYDFPLIGFDDLQKFAMTGKMQMWKQKKTAVSFWERLVFKTM